ncbi:MFS transporter [Candidatus Peregrinibacteria bacterium]|nr:MFS transporter [Candidatus Peregrinibacteria bacterium]
MRNFLFNKALRILLITNALILISAAMLGPIYAIFVEKVGGDLLDASIAGGLFALTGGLATLLSGKMSDKVRHSEFIIILGYAFMGTGFFLYQYVNTVEFLFVIQMIIGLGQATYSPAFDKLYSMHLDNGKGGTEWGAWESMYYFTTAAGAFVGGLIVTKFGFNAIFVIMAMLCYLSASYLYLLAPKRVF